TRGVYLAVNNLAAFHAVKVGIEGNERTEILDGVAEGDRVVTTGAAGLRNGDPIVLAGGGPGGRGGRAGGGRGNRGGAGAPQGQAGPSAEQQPAASATKPESPVPNPDGAAGQGRRGGFGGGRRGGQRP